MERYSFPIISKLLAACSTFVLLSMGSCQVRDPYNDLVEGTIAYPFIEPANPIGYNGNQHDDKFVVRTLAGQTEYVVEIPQGAQFYDVEIPIAQLSGTENGDLKKIKNPQNTDRELVANLPKLSAATREEQALLDQAFGVGEPGGPRQAPSYVVGIAKVNDLYRQTKYEYALVEINNMLAFYPTSAQLYKMKGTVLIKLNNFQLAERAWFRGLELAPNDPVLKKGLERLRKRIETNRDLARNTQVEAAPESPKPPIPQ